MLSCWTGGTWRVWRSVLTLDILLVTSSLSEGYLRQILAPYLQFYYLFLLVLVLVVMVTVVTVTMKLSDRPWNHPVWQPGGRKGGTAPLHCTALHTAQSKCLGQNTLIYPQTSPHLTSPHLTTALSYFSTDQMCPLSSLLSLCGEILIESPVWRLTGPQSVSLLRNTMKIRNCLQTTERARGLLSL